MVVCNANQIQIIDPVTGSVVGCEDCKMCPAGLGASVACGGSVTANTGVRCVPCLAGTDFSAGNSANECNKCAECGPNRAVTHKCTATADTECGQCEKGYHLSGWTGFCEPQVDVAGISHLTVAPSPSPTPTHENESNKSTAGRCPYFFLQEWKVFGRGDKRDSLLGTQSIFCLVLFCQDFTFLRGVILSDCFNLQAALQKETLKLITEPCGVLLQKQVSSR